MNIESATGPKEKMVSVTVLPTASRAGSDKVVLKFKSQPWNTIWNFETPTPPAAAKDVDAYTEAIKSIQLSTAAILALTLSSIA